ncbi:MAG: glycosyltransferase [bacterium]
MTAESTINVLQLVEGLNLGGAETKLLELISQMDRSRFKTTVCSLGMGDRIREAVEKLNVNYVGLQRKSRIDLSLVFKVAKLIRREKIDVVMTTLFYADVVGALAGSLGHAKAVFSWETISAPEWLLKRRLWAYRFAMRYCDTVVSVSDATAKWLIEKRGLRPDKVVVIPYGVNLDLFRQGKNNSLKNELQIPLEAPVVGVVARLHPQKGHRYLIEAAGKIVEQLPETRFVLVGDGELRGELEALVQAKKLDKHFLFLGFRNDVKELMRTFDIFVLPSLYEGLPNVILEAMATGLPVVATAVDGSPELVVNEQTGYLIPPRDPEQIAEKVLNLFSDQERRQAFGKRSRERVEKHFSLDLQVQNFQNLYEKFVTNGHSK